MLSSLFKEDQRGEGGDVPFRDQLRVLDPTEEDTGVSLKGLGSSQEFRVQESAFLTIWGEEKQ